MRHGCPSILAIAQLGWEEGIVLPKIDHNNPEKESEGEGGWHVTDVVTVASHL
jgi:hypothetical protein